MSTFAKIFATAVASFVVAGLAVPAFAETQWERNHPRRDQVNDRIQNQMHRINQDERRGELSPGQARALRQQDRSVLRQERRDARMDGGHITRGEQARLNRELNGINREIPR